MKAQRLLVYQPLLVVDTQAIFDLGYDGMIARSFTVGVCNSPRHKELQLIARESSADLAGLSQLFFFCQSSVVTGLGACLSSPALCREAKFWRRTLF